MIKPESKRQRLDLLVAQLEQERSSFIPHYRDIADYIRPRTARFSTTDTNRGDKRNQKIIDNTATVASRVLRAGMQSGVTSPARRFFQLATPDPELNEFGRVKEWLHLTSERINTVLLKSNYYNVKPIVYGNMGDYGTAAYMQEEDFEQVTRFTVFPTGSYMIAVDAFGRVNTFARDFRMTVRNLVQKFGKIDQKTGKPDWSNFSLHVRNLWEQGNTQAWIDVVHVIYPNDDYRPLYTDSKNAKFASCYYEKGASSASRNSYIETGDMNKFLREKGYDYFPVKCPRWEVMTEDSFGTSCPGMDALGDIKALQMLQKRKAQAVEKMVNPPMIAPTSMRNVRLSLIAGDTSYVDEREAGKGVRPAHEVSPRIQELLLDIQDHQRRIDEAYYKNLFQMFANDQTGQMTAREVAERSEEKLLAVGPVLEQLNQDDLDPTIDTTFLLMERQGLIPPPPEELQGMELKVEYISVMAQAQKLVGVSGIERLAGFVGNIAAVKPDVVDKIDLDQMVDEYGIAVGVSPRIIRPDEKVEEMRAERAQAQQAQAKAEQIAAISQSAQTLSQTKMDEDSALTRMLGTGGNA